MRRLAACVIHALAVSGLAPAAAEAGESDFVDTFEAASNVGGWTYLFLEEPAVPEPSGGNPGGHIRIGLCCGELFPPALRSNGSSPFTGDYRARRVTSLAVDLFAHAMDQLSPATGLPVSLRLVTDAGTPGDPSDDYGAWFQGGPQHVPPVFPAEGWRTVSFEIPSGETSLPSGWTLVGTSLIQPGVPPGATWDALIQRVTRVVFEYGPAEPLFPSDTMLFYDVSADNATIETAEAIPALPAPAWGALLTALAGTAAAHLRRRRRLGLP